MFLHLSVILLTGACVVAGEDVCGCRGVHVWWEACVVGGGMVAGGCVWLLGGMCGCRAACVVAGGACMVAGGHAWLLGGHAWLLGVCMVAVGHVWLLWGVHGCQGGMHGCWGAFMVTRRACVGYDEIWSMSGQYASYWNAFLLSVETHQFTVCYSPPPLPRILPILPLFNFFHFHTVFSNNFTK